MKIPKNLVKLAEQVQKKKEETAIADATARQLEKAKRNAEIASRQKRGLKYARKIFKWVKEFSNMPEGIKLIRTGMKYNFREGIFIFTEKVSGRGSRALGISEEGLWWMAFGCGARENYVGIPEDLAEEVEPEILELACETLDDGRVWKCIEEQMERRLSE